MNSEHCPRRTIAAQTRSWVLLGLIVAILALAGCSPPPADESNVEPPAEAATDPMPEEPSPYVSQLDALLERLGEPKLAENCTEGTTTYRIARLEWESGAAAVRVFSEAEDDDGGYRSVFSAAIGQTIASDGYVNDRRWNLIDSEFQEMDFWNVDPDVFAPDSIRTGIMFVEACKDGAYHLIRSEPRHLWLTPVVTLLSRTGKLQWLETGRRDFSYGDSFSP